MTRARPEIFIIFYYLFFLSVLIISVSQVKFVKKTREKHKRMYAPNATYVLIILKIAENVACGEM